MEIKFCDIELAFDYVNSAPMTANTAVICKETGEFFYRSDYSDEDDAELVVSVTSSTDDVEVSVGENSVSIVHVSPGVRSASQSPLVPG